MRVKGALPPLFTIFTITYKVAVYAPAERADKLPLFRLYPYVYSVDAINFTNFWMSVFVYSLEIHYY